MAMKRGKERDGDDKGPLPKAKSKSLKLASQEMEKAVVPAKCMEEMLSGMARNRHITGNKQRSRTIPLGVFLVLPME